MKSLGIYLNKHLNWESQIAHVNSKLTKNIGIFYKLRHCFRYTHAQAADLLYTLICPYLSYGAKRWSNI